MHHDRDEKTIAALPNEILLTVFSYLQAYDVKCHVSKVCVQWSDLARDKKLWRQLNFKTTTRSTKVFGVSSWYSTLRFLESSPELQNVVVSQGHSEDEILEILRSLNDHCRNLHHIEFNVDLGPVVKHLKNLKNVLDTVESLSLNLFPCPTQRSLLRVLPAFKRLRRLTFHGANPDTFEFRLILRECLHLEHLSVSGVDFTKANFTSLWRAKDRFVGLAMKIDRLDESCLKLLSVFPNLKDLSLADGNSSPGKLLRVGRLKCLKKLHLQEHALSPVLTASALTDFFQTGQFEYLKELKLHKSRLNDEGAAEIRRNCPSLTYLEVMTYPRCVSSLSEKALLHFVHCKGLRHFEILFDSSEEADWIYRRIRYVSHECDIDGICPIGLQTLLESWDEVQIPVD